jgi:hypothetical protein
VATLSTLRLSGAQLARFGEPVLLPSADGEDPVEVSGIFDPIGEPAGGGGFGSEVGLVGRLSSQPNPVLWLQDADAVGVAEGTEVQIRWTPYRIVRKDPDGAGLTRCELMPGSAPVVALDEETGEPIAPDRYR